MVKLSNRSMVSRGLFAASDDALYTVGKEYNCAALRRAYVGVYIIRRKK